MLLSAVVALVATRAEAAMMHHHDLRSLFFMSDAAVKAVKLGERKIGPYQKVTSFRVLTSWQGALSKGDRIDVAGPSPYALTTPFASGPEPSPEDEMVLFLQRADAGQRKRLEAAWLVAPSGLRIVLSGRVQRFEQWSNPGPYVPVPQGRDPQDILGLPGGERALTMEAFESELADAKHRADEVRAAIAGDDPKRLVAALGPALEDRRYGSVSTPLGLGFFADAAATAILGRLDELGELTALLEGVSRVRGGVVWFRMHDLKTTDAALLAVALDAARSRHLRLAAMAVLASRWRSGKLAAGVKALQLLRDGDPQIREAAASTLARIVDEKLIEPAVEQRWKIESDPDVQCRLLFAAQRLEITKGLQRSGRPELVVAMDRDHDVVTIDHAWFGADSWRLSQAEVVLAREGAAKRVIDLLDDEQAGGWSSTGHAGMQRRIRADPPIEPGTYHVTVNAKLARSSGGSKAIAAERDLGTWTVRPGRERTPEVSAVEAPSPAPTAAPASPEVVVVTPSPARTGCSGCASSSGGDDPRGMAWGLLLVVGLVVTRRWGS
jgi:MYXO-CTERM domain-containing protein